MPIYTVEIEKDGQTYEIDIEGPESAPQPSAGGGLPPLPAPPTAAETLSQMSVPPVPKANALSPDSLVKAAGENILPPGIAFKGGLPVLSMDSLKRGMSPMAGQYGVSAPMEAAGAKVENAVVPAGENLMTDNPLARNFPKTNAVAMTLPAIALDMAAPALRPSSVQQQIGAQGVGMGMQPVKAVVKKGIGKYGKLVHNVDEAATAQAIKNPKVMDEDFSSPDKIEHVTRGLKKALEDTRRTISGLYDTLKKKLDKGGKGKVDFNAVTEPLNKARKQLKVGESGLTKIDAAEEGRIQQLGKEVSQEINNKVLNDFLKGKGRLPKKTDKKALEKALDAGKFTAEDMLEIRKRISREIDFDGSTDLYKKELLGLRGTVDDAIRTKYPKLKELDAKTAGVKKAEATLRRKTGIVAGRDLNEVNQEKVGRLSRSLFGNDKGTLRKAVSDVSKKIGAEDVFEEMKDIGAAQQFDTSKDALVQLFGMGINPRKITKGIFKSFIRGSKAVSNKAGKSLPYVSTGISGSVKDREK